MHYLINTAVSEGTIKKQLKKERQRQKKELEALSRESSDTMEEIVRISEMVNDVWRVSGGCLEGIWQVSGKCLEGVWKVSGGCLEDVWRMSGRCLESVWKLYLWCLEFVLKVSGQIEPSSAKFGHGMFLSF